MRAPTQGFGAFVLAICASFAFLGAAVAAGPVPNVSGVWLAYVPRTTTSPNQTFVIRQSNGSARIKGEWGGEFKLSGTVSRSTGKAKLCAGCGQAGVTQTTNFDVTFVFKSPSSAQANHPTFSGTYHYVEVASGETKPGGTIRAIRCRATTGAKSVAAC